MKLLLLYIFSIILTFGLYGQEADQNKLNDDFFRYIEESNSIAYGYIEPAIEAIRIKFIDKGLDINTKDKNENTLLHIAAMNNNLNLFYVAIAFNPSPLITNRENRTPKQEIGLYIKEHGEDNSSLEIYNYLDNYEIAYQTKQNMLKLKKIDKLNSVDDKIQVLDNFIDGIENTNEIVGAFVLYDMYKRALTTPQTKERIELIDQKWINHINVIIERDLLLHENILKSTDDIKRILQTEDLLVEIDKNLSSQLNKKNYSMLASLIISCQIRFSELSQKRSIIELENDTKRLIPKIILENQSITKDQLIDEAILFILDKEKPFDKKKNLVLQNIMSLISRNDYKGIYKQDEFLSSLKDLYMLNRSYNFTIDSKTKVENIQLMLKKIKNQYSLLKSFLLRVN